MTSRMEEGGAEEPQTVDQARDAVERSRERISRTLDRLEDRIVEKKHELQDKADVFKPVKNQVRSRPLTAVAVAVGVGALLGSLGGRHDEEELDFSGRGGAQPLSEAERRELREWRRHRRERLRAFARGEERYGGGRIGAAQSRLDSLKSQLMGAATTAITAAITSRVKELARGGGSGRSSKRRRDREASWD